MDYETRGSSWHGNEPGILGRRGGGKKAERGIAKESDYGRNRKSKGYLPERDCGHPNIGSEKSHDAGENETNDAGNEMGSRAEESEYWV